MCNNAVACGKDVLGTADIESIVNEKKSKINVFVISENDIASISKICAAKLKPVAQSNQVHQIVWSKEKKNTLEFRYLTCSMCTSLNCTHYKLDKSRANNS